MSAIRKTIFAAVSRNGIIGRDGDMPWRLSSDLKRFKAMTLGKPVVMGRKTYDSIGRPLPGRQTVDHPDVRMAGSLAEAIAAAEALARQKGEDEICIIGGGQIYAQAIGIADRMCITHVEADIEGDTSFPAIDPATWQGQEAVEVPAGEKDSHATRFIVYDRRQA
jgi:dihydrofolate reductase